MTIDLPNTGALTISATSTEEAARLLEEASRLRACGQMARATERYADVLKLQPANLEAHNIIESAGGAESYGSWMGVNCRIDPRDEIFRFFANHPSSRNPIRDYLADGWRTLAELMHLLEIVDKPLTQVKSFLEFAAGFGRFTRHLAKVIPGRLTCADVQPGTVDFLRAEFGVDGFYSSATPEDIAINRKFEIVFVLSLFSHLPPKTWISWLRALHAFLLPGGLLIFTFHGEAFAEKSGVELPADGTLFIPSSESRALQEDQYGTTFVSRAYVEDVVSRALGSAINVYRRLWFWSGQDVVIVANHEPARAGR